MQVEKNLIFDTTQLPKVMVQDKNCFFKETSQIMFENPSSKFRIFKIDSILQFQNFCSATYLTFYK